MTESETRNLKYKDGYGIIYECEWKEILKDGVKFIDFTILTKYPYFPDKPKSGYVKDYKIIYYGHYSILRQIFEVIEDNYTILMEGYSYGDCEVPASDACLGYTDKFKYHLNNSLTEANEFVVNLGSGFDNDSVFPEIDTDGTIILGTEEAFTFVDVW